MSQYQGSLVPVVCGKNDLAVAANPAATRTCTIAAGSAAGQGVLTTSSATESVTFGVVSTSGQTRWDAVVLRRNWASSGSASFVVAAGTAAASAPMVLPSGVDSSLDGTHDHVLALVQITYNNTVPTAVVDRRLQGSKVFTAPALSALPPASVALYGMEAVLPTGERYRCLDSGGSPSWLSDWSTATNAFTTATGWGSVSTSLTRKGDWASLIVSATRTSTAIGGGTHGNLGDIPIATLTGTGPRPPGNVGGAVVAGPLVGTVLTPAGVVLLGAIAPNYTLPSGAAIVAQFVYPIN
jgi:hypothetical protein